MKQLLLPAPLAPFCAHAAEFKIPSGMKIKLVIGHQDAKPEEFDRHQLKGRSMFAEHSTATIYPSPLSPGRCPFGGEFHDTTAQRPVDIQ